MVWFSGAQSVIFISIIRQLLGFVFELFKEPFLIEMVVFFCLPIFLIATQAFGSARNGFDAETNNKKGFFILVRFVQLVCVVVLLSDFCQGFFLASDFDVLHSGNYFFRTDRFTRIFLVLVTGLLLFYCSLLTFLFSRTTVLVSYILELPFLLVCTLLGLRLLVATNDFFLLVILLELLAFCSVIFLGLQSTSGLAFSLSVEATLKYFLINALAVIVFLFGLAGYFFLTAETNLLNIVGCFQQQPHLVIFFIEQLVFSNILILFAWTVKVGGAPAHQWVPDVYEGAETIVTCFLVLLIGPVLLLKFFQTMYGLTLPFKNLAGLLGALQGSESFVLLAQLPTSLIWGIGLVSIFVGTLGAFYQSRIKRFIAYSSITHLGFMFLSLVPGNSIGYFALFTYLVIYIITNLCFFTLLLVCQHYFYTEGTRLMFINQFKPYMQSSVFFFFLFLVTLLSFAGIPPFAGFFAKFVVLYTLATNGFELTVLVLLLAIIIGTFMYLRFIKIALFEPTSFFKAFLQTLSTASRAHHGQSYYLHSGATHSLFYSTPISGWHERLLFGLIFGCSFLLCFVFFISVYFTFIFDLTLGFLSV